MCITSFSRIASVMFLTFYIWAVIGTQILHPSNDQLEEMKDNEELAYYAGSTFGHFHSFSDSMLALFQILTESSWHMIVLYAEVYNGFWIPCILLCPFHLFITFIMRSILVGLIWEVFAVVNNTQSEQSSEPTPEESLINHKMRTSIKTLSLMQINKQEGMNSEENEIPKYLNTLSTRKLMDKYEVDEFEPLNGKHQLHKSVFETNPSSNVLKLKRFMRRRKICNLDISHQVELTKTGHYHKMKMDLDTERRSRSQSTKVSNVYKNDLFHMKIELIGHELEEMSETDSYSSSVSE